MTMCKFGWSLAVVFFLLTTGFAYKFILQGKTTAAPDGRTAILLTSDERDMVLSEMRIFLQSVQQVARGVADDDLNHIALSAQMSGSNAQMGMPGTLVGKLPLEFKKLGFDTHARFDQLALDADQLGDADHALTQLSEVLGNCVACHSTYRFEVEHK